MSDVSRQRIRAQGSVQDADLMGFVLDAPVTGNRKHMLRGCDSTPLSDALFALADVQEVTVSHETIWVRKVPDADWTTLKPAIAGAIRSVLNATEFPLGPQMMPDDDTALLRAVSDLLERQVNPSVAAHGGHIAVERVERNSVYLRMSGGCQGCAASSATLREGVERMLRAALPQITEIIDLTDHDSGTNPFYAKANGPSPMLRRPLPPNVIGYENGQITVDPDYLAPRLGLTPDTLRAALRNGEVVGVTEVGQAEDAGKTRIIMRSTARSWAAEIDATGTAHEIPPPRRMPKVAARDRDLAAKIRAYLESVPLDQLPVTYGALARALGLWAPGSIRKVTRALEITMREDASAGRPFIAACAVSRGREGLPGQGFFTLARDLSRGPQQGESDADFHAREFAQLTRKAA
jgi:Fe-S cluster biogenesis protein NfuA